MHRQGGAGLITVRPATLADLTYLDALQRKNAEELSFYPKSVFERELPLGRVVLAEVNAEPAGYLYHGALKSEVKIHQACIEYDLRGQLYGSALVRWLFDLCEASQASSLILRCGSDILANSFWKKMGFECEAVTAGGIRRKRDINLWCYRFQASLFSMSVEPSERKQDASAWRKRSVKLGNQFIRGRALRQYRTLIEE